MSSILFAHRDPKAAETVKPILKAKNLLLLRADDGVRALEIIENEPVVAAWVQQDLPGLDGEQLLRRLDLQDLDIRVVLMSEDPSLKAARSALRAGAYDYLPLPLDENEFSDCLERILEEEAEPAGLPPAGPVPGRFDHIVGQSQAIRSVFRLVEKVADTDSTVMIYGESGTGKELIARALHQHSRRRDMPLIPVNCGAIPEELLESELFGHEKGAFTSAIRMRIGRFEMASGGTIFLDEIADMSPKLQVKILRVLQEQQFERIGGSKTINVDIRVITATNKNLRQAMEHGRFREDLFYRLNVIPMTVPPLRERQADIPLLIEHFLHQFHLNKGSRAKSIDHETMARLMAYPWPGNIRELENLVERMVILAENETLTVVDLPARIREAVAAPGQAPVEIPEEGIDFNQVVSDFEDQLLLQALEKAGWVKNKAANLLKLNRTTLVEKLKKKKINPPGG